MKEQFEYKSKGEIVRSARQIGILLTELKILESIISVDFKQGKVPFPTQIISVDHKKQHFSFDAFTSKFINQLSSTAESYEVLFRGEVKWTPWSRQKDH